MAQTTLFWLRFVLFMILLVSNIYGLSLKMIPIDSPHLQLLPEYITDEERHQFLINISISKVNNYPIREAPNGVKTRVRSDGKSYYVTKLGFGTGEGRLFPTMVIDTGSRETWVQCEGCDPCIESKAKNFNYKISTTFRKMSVDDPLCIPRLAYEGSCAFEVKYGYEIQPHISGFLGRDVIYFMDGTTGNMVARRDYALGCAIKNEGWPIRPDMPENMIIGILGLAPSPRSFLAQTKSLTKGRISYCLAAGSGISNMYLGDEAQISGDATREVKTIAMNTGIYYHVYLNAISVDGVRLPIDPSIFELDVSTYRKGFFIDSGAPKTLLANSAFIPFRDAIVKYFSSKFGWRPATSRGLCYKAKYPIDAELFPSVIFHFAGVGQQGEVDWVMDKRNLFIRINQHHCLTVRGVPDPGPSLLGAYQQINFKVLYDILDGVFSFVPQVCQEVSF